MRDVRVAAALSAVAAGSAAAAWVLARGTSVPDAKRDVAPDIYDGGLDNVVGATAQTIAAARALETLKGQDALVQDPLAQVLAGPKAMARAIASRQQQAAQADEQEQPSSASESAGSQSQQKSVNKLIIRTVYFDQAVQLCTGSWQSKASGQALPETLVSLQAALQGTACKQVVLLGAGMDTRAWRLDLPPGVLWVEVDQTDVLAAKRTIMGRVGAALEAAPSPSQSSTPAGAATGTTYSSQTKEGKKQEGGSRPSSWWGWWPRSSKGASSSGSGAGNAYPLRAARYVGVAADLQAPGWPARLVAEAGLDPAQPICWILEGLTYYLAPDSVPAMLKEAASVSAPGSALVASVWSEEFVRAIQAKPGRSADDPMASVKWGCPGSKEQWAEFFGACSWRVLGSPYYGDVAKEWRVALSQARRGKGATQDMDTAAHVGYVTAVLQG